jgi:hypothetical protein
MASRMSAEAFTTDVARSLRAASIARCAVSSGGFASYRRDPLGEAHREGRGLVTTFSTASSLDRQSLQGGREAVRVLEIPDFPL